MGRVKAAYYSGQLKKPRNKRRPQAKNPYQKPSFWKRGSWKGRPSDRKGVLRKSLFYGRWLGWREGRRGGKARFRPPGPAGSLEAGLNYQFNKGYAQGYNEGRVARKQSFRKPQRNTKQGTYPRKMGPNGSSWPKKPITRGLTAEDVAKYKYGKATPSNVAAVKRNMGDLLRPERKPRAKVATTDGKTWTHKGVRVHSRKVGNREWTHRATIDGKPVAIRTANADRINKDSTVQFLRFRRIDLEG